MSLHQQPQQQQELPDSEAYKNFINSVNSSITRYDYDKIFSYFMAYCKINRYDDMLAIGPKIEGVIRDYIIYLSVVLTQIGYISNYPHGLHFAAYS